MHCARMTSLGMSWWDGRDPVLGQILERCMVKWFNLACAEAAAGTHSMGYCMVGSCMFTPCTSMPAVGLKNGSCTPVNNETQQKNSDGVLAIVVYMLIIVVYVLMPAEWMDE